MTGVGILLVLLMFGAFWTFYAIVTSPRFDDTASISGGAEREHTD